MISFLFSAMHQEFSTAAAYQWCRDLAQSHYENFPIASLFIPKRRRRHFFACYAFLRMADDMADEDHHSAAFRLQRLNDWEAQLNACYQGEATHPVFIALAETVRELEIPQEWFIRLLNAFKTDLFKNRYRTFDELLEYCDYSANPVGRLVLHMLGYGRHPAIQEIHNASDAICTGLQLANHWQDVFVDQKKNRLYLPLEDLESFDYSVEMWHQGVVDLRFRALMEYQVNRAESFFLKGKNIFAFLRFPESREIRLIWHGGMRILEKIKKNQYDVRHFRPEIKNLDKVIIFFRQFRN